MIFIHLIYRRKAMPQTELSTIEKGLISTAAAIASGCKPCTAVTVHHSRAVGASEKEIKRATAIGLEVKHNAYHDIYQETQKHSEVPAGESRRDEFKGETPIEWLMATGAAFAANFTLGLEHYSATAEQLGATVSDLNMVLEIARRVKEQAGREAEKTASMVAPIHRQGKSVSGGCGCTPDKAEDATTCCP
jgi:AhpD family alkylhydroperoxidase